MNPVNCYTVKMTQFIPWFLDEDPRPDYWEDLYNEYIGLRENKSSAYVLNLVKEITYLRAKHTIVEQCCKLLNICFTHFLTERADEIKAILRQYNFRFPYDLGNEMMFSQNIRATLSLNKKAVSTWQRKEKELNDYHEKHSGKAWTRKDFYVWAVTLGEHQGYRLDLEAVTVAEWAASLNKYEQYCELINAKNHGKQYGRGKQNR